MAPRLIDPVRGRTCPFACHPERVCRDDQPTQVGRNRTVAITRIPALKCHEDRVPTEVSFLSPSIRRSGSGSNHVITLTSAAREMEQHLALSYRLLFRAEIRLVLERIGESGRFESPESGSASNYKSWIDPITFRAPSTASVDNRKGSERPLKFGDAMVSHFQGVYW
jgi:hypothetical protein